MDTAYIKQFIEELLSKLSISVELEVKDDDELHMTVFSLTTEDSHLLIGHHGETLNALSHIVKKAADHHSSNGERVSFILDVNEYQRKRISEIKGRANIFAERARYFKSSVEMDPMSPYERMIVHALFSGVKDIKTESAGFGKGRHIVVSYVEPEAEVF